MKLLIVLLFLLGLNACTSLTAGSQKQLSNLNLDIAMDYLNKRRPVMAKRHLLFALEEAPKNPAVLAGYGLYLESVGGAQAEQYYQKAVAFNPNSAMAHNNLGAYFCRHQQYLAAFVQFQRVLKQPRYLYLAQTYENMGICSKLAHKPQQARQYFKKALQYDPSLSLSKEMLAK